MKPRKRAIIARSYLISSWPEVALLDSREQTHSNYDHLILDEVEDEPREQDARSASENVECEVGGSWRMGNQSEDPQAEEEEEDCDLPVSMEPDAVKVART
jgi:hypothetical protein